MNRISDLTSETPPKFHYELLRGYKDDIIKDINKLASEGYIIDHAIATTEDHKRFITYSVFMRKPTN